VKEHGPNDPYYASRASWGQPYDDQWALKRIGFTSIDQTASVWDVVKEAKDDVIVAVIDSGLDYFHPDLKRENVWRNTREILNRQDDDRNGYIDDVFGWNFADKNNDLRDELGHGTHVSGIIAAATDNGEGIAGMNPRVKIMPLKILDARGRGESTGVAEAIFYAVRHGARVINLSLGGERVSKTEQLAIGYALRKGVVVVVAADSAGRKMVDYPPAGLRDVITVAATDQNDKRARSSGWGQGIDIAAPGVDILSLRAQRTEVRRAMGTGDYKPGTAFVGPEARYYRASGTSFAAAFVSGAASLLLAKNPKLTNTDVKRILLMSADDVEFPGWDQLTGYGRLNVARALAADPAFLLDARIDRVEIVDGAGGTVLRVDGVADANDFESAWMELGRGESPRQWRTVSATLRRPVQDGVLGEVPAVALRGGDTWTLRLVAEHANGLRRVVWHRLNVR
jgi:subtilisin family serine protease